MKTYEGIAHLLIRGTTNGLHTNIAKTKGISFDLLLEQASENSKSQPDRLIIKVEGHQPRELGFLSILPDGSMSVEAALLLWGRNSAHLDKVKHVLRSIAAMRADEFNKL